MDKIVPTRINGGGQVQDCPALSKVNKVGGSEKRLFETTKPYVVAP